MDGLLPKKSIRVNAVRQNDVNYRNQLNSFDDISSLELCCGITEILLKSDDDDDDENVINDQSSYSGSPV
jgi:hypothetical protein